MRKEGPSPSNAMWLVYQHAADDRDRRIADGLDAMAEEAGLRPPETGPADQEPPRPAVTRRARRRL